MGSGLFYKEEHLNFFREQKTIFSSLVFFILYEWFFDNYYSIPV